MTPEGHKKMQERLRFLKTAERHRIAKVIEHARGFGDLSENAEYDSAKEAQAQMEIEIRSLEDKLARAEVIDPAKLNHAKVTFGATVILEETDNGERRSFQIVGADESDIKAGKISVVSPIAKALIGKEKGDAVQVQTPKGLKEFEILTIEFK